MGCIVRIPSLESSIWGWDPGTRTSLCNTGLVVHGPVLPFAPTLHWVLGRDSTTGPNPTQTHGPPYPRKEIKNTVKSYPTPSGTFTSFLVFGSPSGLLRRGV